MACEIAFWWPELITNSRFAYAIWYRQSDLLTNTSHVIDWTGHHSEIGHHAHMYRFYLLSHVGGHHVVTWELFFTTRDSFSPGFRIFSTFF